MASPSVSPWQRAVAHGNDLFSGVENLFGFVQTQIEKLDQIVNRGLRQRVDVVDSVFRQRVGLLRESNLR